MKIAIAQINPTIGDLSNNCLQILTMSQQAKKIGADLVVLPELSLIGYPPKDLLLRGCFLDAQIQALNRLTKEIALPVIVGAVIKIKPNELPFNVAVLCKQSKWKIIAKKTLLPNYNVFDEKRYFKPPTSKSCSVITFNKKKLLISICEDAWSNILVEGKKYHSFDPIHNAIAKHGKVDVIINMSASPFSISKPKIRKKIFTDLAMIHKTPVLLAGQVGGNDQLLFDGHSMVIAKDGRIISHAKTCEPDLLLYDQSSVTTQVVSENLWDCHSRGSGNPGVAHRVPASAEVTTPGQLLVSNKECVDDDSLLVNVLLMGIKDYVEKCQTPGVIIGLSGGIDSAVCTTLAVMALGPKRVRAVFLPSEFSSAQSFSDAKALAGNLSIDLEVLSIEESVKTLRNLLKNTYTTKLLKNVDLMEQNIQSRLRGMIIMALSNASDYLMIATSNKSELAVGYATLYGDMCGAFSAIGDLYKTQVYKIAETINKHKMIIPQSIIERPPTAELKPNQLDSDVLPDYLVLDKILYNFIELEKSAKEIELLTKLPPELIHNVIKMVNRSEYKRRQGPFCLMVSDKVFGDARRLPIAKFI